ncbi:phage tail-like protein [Agromyces terreus]|uniref:Phage tail-like protein n=1 Tax=Agromyces terreus TaxID=424795 RepID=A0A9X2KBA7_9MICO|nr:phage tail protein [Agromyces terreus]MCP2369970.1 phage tail-like protein [Agromyces terreus]
MPDLENPSPFITRVPAVLQEDEFLQRWLTAFDASVAPIISVLDNLEAYVHPGTTPPDFLDWLSGWVDVELDENWPVEQRRKVVADAAGLHRRAGRFDGVAETMQLVAGPEAEVEVAESGGTSWSTTAHGSLPGSADGTVRVRIVGAAGARGDVEAFRRRIERAARRVVPAHLRIEIEITEA